MRLYEFALGGLVALGMMAGCGGAAESMAPSSPMGSRGQGQNEAAPSRQELAATTPMKDRAPGDADERGGAPPPPPPAAPAVPGPQNAPTKPEAAHRPPQTRDYVIYTAQFTMAVYQVDTGIAAIERIAREHDGYLSAKKDREIVIRVPRAQFEAAVAKVDRVGDVLHRDIAALDVTDEHVDLEIRIKNARAMQKQLTDLLSRANVKEALEIEKELGRVTEELERLEGRLKLLNDKIAFSTIAVVFEARGQTLQTQRVRLPFPWLNTLNLPTLLQLNEDK